MKEVIEKPRVELSKNAPRMIGFDIDTEKIKDVIGPGGKNIRKIIDQTGVDIDIQNDGSVKIFSTDSDAASKAIRWPLSITRLFLKRLTGMQPEAQR